MFLFCLGLLLTTAAISSGQTEAPPSAPCKYAQYAPGRVHTGCLPPNASCRIVTSGVDATNQALIVKLHNNVRNAVATGKQTGAEQKLLPTAQNMRQMVWNDELAFIAQKLTDQCKLAADCFDCRSVEEYVTGEALYYQYNNEEPQRENWAAAIGFWSNQAKQLTSVEGAKKYTQTSFTQMIWARTKDIGCGFTRFRGGSVWRYVDFYVCIYGPAGNYLGQDIYETGTTCEDCSYRNTCCGDKCKLANTTPDYPGLCKLTKN